MSDHVSPLSRRGFLAGAVAAGVGLLVRRDTAVSAVTATTRIDPNRFALLADTHIAGAVSTEAHGANMARNLRRVCQQVLALRPLPAALFIAGDCAYHTGETEDYETLLRLLAPIREHGIALHLALGNHDHRERFWHAAPWMRTQPAAGLPDRHVALVESPLANWFVLDSLEQTHSIPGSLGSQQLKWLARALDARPDKPALVLLHHHPDSHPNPIGLRDTGALLDLVMTRKQIKALLFGHTHWRAIHDYDGLQAISLPPVGYILARGQTAGWVDCRLRPGGAALQFHGLDDTDPAANPAELRLRWRPRPQVPVAQMAGAGTRS